MEDLLRELDYPDTKVAEDIRNGFPLTGEMPSTGVFAKKPEENVEKPKFSGFGNFAAPKPAQSEQQTFGQVNVSKVA